jgi:hypothetical protein
MKRIFAILGVLDRIHSRLLKQGIGVTHVPDLCPSQLSEVVGDLNEVLGSAAAMISLEKSTLTQFDSARIIERRTQKAKSLPHPGLIHRRYPSAD